jgi:hypothetical protein
MNSAMSRASHLRNHGETFRSWQEWEIAGRERRIVLCVETALEMRPGMPGFDATQLDALVDHATQLMHASPSPIDLIRLIPQH